MYENKQDYFISSACNALIKYYITNSMCHEFQNKIVVIQITEMSDIVYLLNGTLLLT